MKKKILVLSIAISLGLTGCTDGTRLEKETGTRNQILLNSGSEFVYTFCDEETGVWYISNVNGVTPRLNLDGTLYGYEQLWNGVKSALLQLP